MNVNSWKKILDNLAYKAPEVQAQYLLAELQDYVRAYEKQAARIAELEKQVAESRKALTPEQKFDDAYGMLNQ